MQAPGGGYEVGVVKAWKEERGMGFISPVAGGDDLFVHRSNIADAQSLVEGSQVYFERGWDQMKGKPICKGVMASTASGMNGFQAGNAMQAQAVPPPPPSMPPAELVQQVQQVQQAQQAQQVQPVPQSVPPPSFVTNGAMGMEGAYAGTAEAAPPPPPVTPPPQPVPQSVPPPSFAADREMGKGAAKASTAAVVPPPAWAPGGSGGGSGPAPASTGSYTGIVKAWMEHRGMGFISPNSGEADLFAHRSNLIDCQSLTPGVTVTFDSEWDMQKNKPIAKRIRLATNSNTGNDFSSNPSLQALTGSSDYGNEMQTWSSNSSSVMDPQDKAALEALSGSSDLGAPLTDWSSEPASLGGTAPDTAGASATSTTDMSVFDAFAASVSEAGLGQPPATEQPSPGGPLALSRSGLVKVWFEEKSYGFLTPNDGGNDCFVHRSALKGCAMLFQGSTVSFDTKWDAGTGKEIATACVCTSPTSAQAGGGMQSGTVKVWFEDRGFGFIAADDGSGDAFVHRAALTDGSSLVAGAQIWFEAQWNDIKKKSTATKVLGASGVPGAGAAPAGPGALAIQGWAPGMDASAGAAEVVLPSDNLYIQGLPLDTTDDMVANIFGSYGNVTSVKVLANSGKPDCAAMVRMGDIPQAQWLVDNLNGNVPVGLSGPIQVRFAKPSTSSYGKGGGKGMDNRYSPYGGPPPPAASGGVPASWMTLAAPPAATSNPGERQTGIVKVWMDARGMGFIAPSAGGDDLFVHRSYLADGQTLVPGTTVSFESSWDVQKNKPIAKLVQGATDAVSVPPPPAGEYMAGQYMAGVADGGAAGMGYGGSAEVVPPPPAVPHPTAEVVPPPPAAPGGAEAAMSLM